jgi:uncharacterized protein YlzI (FlbEa/FlbD family)
MDWNPAFSKDGSMIILTRLNGDQFAVNCDLVERVDAHPNTVLTLVDATKYIVAESLVDVLARSAEMTQRFPFDPTAPASGDGSPLTNLRLVNHQDEG